MARNKHPEETVEKILAVSAKLFMEKGYEHTTLQDIIDNLGGLTKGAIYHHFKGKEEILLAITAHSHQIAKHIYCKSRIVYIIFYILPYIGDKLPVDILRAVDAFVFMIILIVHIQTPVFASQKGAVDQQIGDGSF